VIVCNKFNYLLHFPFNIENPVQLQSSSSSVSSSSSDQFIGKSRKSKSVTPDKDSLKRKKVHKYSDQSYEDLEAMDPEELRTLNRMQHDAYRANDAYEDLVDVENELKEEVNNLLTTKNKYDVMVTSFKEYLDLKYRSKL